ncbi:MAG: hypothetical protein ACREPN_12365 [Rudaea sp.]
MNKPSLTQIYRRHVGRNVPDAQTVLDGSDPATPLHAQLQRFSRDLEPVSAQLAVDIAAAVAVGGAASHQHAGAQPRTIHQRAARWRVAAALAASLLAAVVVWGVRRHALDTQQHVVAAASAPSDRIFAGFNENDIAASSNRRGDEIFRARFVPDEIFNSKRNDG